MALTAFNTSTALVVLRKAIQSIAHQQFDTAEGLLDRYETKLGRQRHISCMARAVIALTRGDEDQAQTLTQRAGVLIHANPRMTQVEHEVLVFLVRQMESIATGESWISLDRIRALLGEPSADQPDQPEDDDPGKTTGAEAGGRRSA